MGVVTTLKIVMLETSWDRFFSNSLSNTVFYLPANHGYQNRNLDHKSVRSYNPDRDQRVASCIGSKSQRIGSRIAENGKNRLGSRLFYDPTDPNGSAIFRPELLISPKKTLNYHKVNPKSPTTSFVHCALTCDC